MISIPMSDTQFAAATQRLRTNGIELTGPTGTLSKDGVTAKYEHAGGAMLASIPRVQFLVAEITLAVNSGEAYLRETIRKALAADPAAMLDVLGVKVVAADACLAAVSRAMTLGGGWAFGRRGGLERIFRDTQAAAVMAPSSDVLKDFIGKASLGLPLF